LKRQWMPAEKAARQIAGHANAASGESILWVIGIDPASDDPLVGASDLEASNWFAQLNAEFVDVVPHIEHLVVPVDGCSLVALSIETDRAPYVVRNPAAGKPGGGSVEFEVPWRTGTSTRTANRSQLLRMLTQTSNRLDAHVSDGQIVLTRDPNGLVFRLEVELYVTVPLEVRRVVIPDHAVVVHVETNVGEFVLRESSLCPVSFRSGHVSGEAVGGAGETVIRSDRQLIMTGSGAVVVLAESWPLGDLAGGESVEWVAPTIKFTPQQADSPTLLESLPFVPGPSSDRLGVDDVARWVFPVCY